MENFRISQRQDKLTAPFHVKSTCLIRVPPCGLKYFYFQTQWMNDQCYWSNLWVLNKSIHRLSSTGIKTSRGDARLPLHELDVPSCCVLSFLSMMPCETESEAATHDLSQAAPQSPDASLAHFWKKVMRPWTKQSQGFQSDPSFSLLQGP